MKIFVSNVTGRYNIFEDVSKTMNFIFNDDSLGKFYEKFEDIEARLGFDINEFTLDNGYGHVLKPKYLIELVLDKIII